MAFGTPQGRMDEEVQSLLLQILRMSQQEPWAVNGESAGLSLPPAPVQRQQRAAPTPSSASFRAHLESQTQLSSSQTYLHVYITVP